MMFKYFSANSTRKYIDILDELVEEYNSTKHFCIGMTPKEANQKKNEIETWRNLYGNYIPLKRKARKISHFFSFFSHLPLPIIFIHPYLPIHRTNFSLLIPLCWSLFSIGPMHATDRQTDVRRAPSLNTSALWGRDIIMWTVPIRRRQQRVYFTVADFVNVHVRNLVERSYRLSWAPCRRLGPLASSTLHTQWRRCVLLRQQWILYVSAYGH